MSIQRSDLFANNENVNVLFLLLCLQPKHSNFICETNLKLTIEKRQCLRIRNMVKNLNVTIYIKDISVAGSWLHKYGNIKWYILYVLFLIKMLELKPSIYIQCRFDINMDFVLKS